MKIHFFTSLGATVLLFFTINVSSHAGIAGSCIKTTNQVCVDGPSTRNINGLDVYRDCWKWESVYDCSSETSNNNCDQYRTLGCTQTSSVCRSSLSNGTCSVYDQVFSCPDNNCVPYDVTVCDASGIYCLDGSCQDQTETPNDGFLYAATSIQAVQDAAADFNSTTMTIWEGTVEFCSRDVTGIVLDCCGVGGIGTLVAECLSSEVALADKRSQALCHQVGTYCSTYTVLGLCVTWTEGHCCFSSKLGRILQEQIHIQQNISWGSPQAPICTGITPDQLAASDFSTMDLSEFYNDIIPTVPLNTDVSTLLTDQLNAMFGTGTQPNVTLIQ